MSSRRTRLAATAFAVVVVALALWTLWLEPASFTVHRHTLALPGLPVACAPLRVAVTSDLHVGSPFNGLDRLRTVVERVRGEAPDLILLPGDFVIQGVAGGRFVAPEESAALLGTLEAPLGVFAVLGNHDWWLDGDRVRAALESVGIPVLEDRAVRVGGSGCGLWVAGVSDLWEAPADIGAALAAVPAEAPVLVFTHNPDVFPDVPARVALTVAGHTHGGQVRLPLLGRPIVPSRFGQRFAAGHVVEGGRNLFVTTGVGTSILPVRFRVPPEAVVLTLESPEQRIGTGAGGTR